MRREFLQCQEELSEKKSQKTRDNEFPIWSTAISSIQSQKGSGVAAYFRLVQETITLNFLSQKLRSIIYEYYTLIPGWGPVVCSAVFEIIVVRFCLSWIYFLLLLELWLPFLRFPFGKIRIWHLTWNKMIYFLVLVIWQTIFTILDFLRHMNGMNIPCHWFIAPWQCSFLYLQRWEYFSMDEKHLQIQFTLRQVSNSVLLYYQVNQKSKFLDSECTIRAVPFMNFIRR